VRLFSHIYGRFPAPLFLQLLANMRQPDTIPPNIRANFTEFHLRWLDTQRRELNATFDQILENVFTEWLARHSEALQASLIYGEVLRHALDEFIVRHKEEFLPVI
jgi:hypothetical protein